MVLFVEITESGWPMEKILIVDDNEEIRKVLGLTLGYGKFRILMAKDGEHALNIVKQERPEVMVLDLMLPGIDGFEVLRRIKSDPDTRNGYVIILTGRSHEEDVDRARDLGADFYLAKPFAPETLIQVIEGVRTGKVSAQDIFDDSQPGISFRASDRPSDH